MRIEPTVDEVINGPRGMLRGIAATVKAQCLVSAISPMFSTLAALAALDRPSNEQSTNHRFFEDWARKYVRPNDSLGCCAKDLYAARCGVLHT
jgi:hypothetical protein